MAGTVVGQRYRIGRTIGVGGMGFVYEAVDLQTGLDVALKALPPGPPDPTRVRRLRREAAAGLAVKNDHVCRVHYLGVERGTPFIVMERLHGHTLRTQLDNAGPPSLPDAVIIVSQLLDALSATHDAGVIHRDIKPSNIFLTESSTDEIPRVKLIDFGLAKLTGNAELNQREPRRDDITAAECVLGTLPYLAPEQLMGVGELDERSDVYAAGVTLFEMVTGQRAYSGSYADLVHEIVLGEIPLARAIRPELPAAIDDVLRMALAKTRDRRFASARAFKRALLAAMQGTPLKQSGVRQLVVELSEEHLEEDGGGADADDFDTLHDSLEEVTPMTRRTEDTPTVRPPPGYEGYEGSEGCEAPPLEAVFDDEPTTRYPVFGDTVRAVLTTPPNDPGDRRGSRRTGG
jgi:serine/threonine-protein kinase